MTTEQTAAQPASATLVDADHVASTVASPRPSSDGAHDDPADRTRRLERAPAPAGDRPSPSEVAAVARAQDGDPAGFEQLVRSYQGELFRLAYRMLHDRGAAEDAVQDTFVTVWRRLPTLADPQAFRAWIYHIATRRCLNVLRQRKTRRTGPAHGEDVATAAGLEPAPPRAFGDIGAERSDEPPTAVQARAARAGLDEALALLPADQRACWVLHEMHDLSYPAIAYAIGVPLSTVRGRISRARHNLTERMASWR